jgi:phosphoglycerate-specific signal transduction histidine kinase
MGQFDHPNKLQVQAELRRIENVPREFWGDNIQELRDRLDEIAHQESQTEVARDERKHAEMIAAARRSRIASFLSVSAAVISAAAAAVSAYYAVPRPAVRTVPLAAATQ